MVGETISSYSFDHVILLLDTPDFENPPSWLSDNFTIIEGGTHAGGSSRNKLIIFPDGTYIELINWITEPKEFFDWAPKSPGLIDFALTTPSSAQDTFDEVTRRLESRLEQTSPAQSSSADEVPVPRVDAGDGGLGVRFRPPLAGGRKRKDGQDVQWHVTKPLLDDTAENVPKPLEKYFPKGRLDTPFFCHDVTDRSLRVPYAEKEISETHPCGARGILWVEVLVPEDKIDSYIRLYTSVLGTKPKVQGGYRYRPTTSVSFLLSTPNPDEEAMKRLRGRVGVVIRAPRDQEDDAWLKERGVGIREVRLFAEAKGEDEVDEMPLDSEGIGASLVLVKEPAGFWEEVS
ncbi:glyoxalase bleomycin resistance protein dioxygenase superfamily [Fonsecaea pedrosoi]|nr:glyoxalase bleomycin resistance protein dioxygenase superfamily [Fonsecaea pedrosoi]